MGLAWWSGLADHHSDALKGAETPYGNIFGSNVVNSSLT